MKSMGANAIRTAHNMPAEALIRICDEIGMMLLVESFDEWTIPKCRKGYPTHFLDWAERDMRNMLSHFRNNPSVVMWSIENEIPDMINRVGRLWVQRLQDICHQMDLSRPVTAAIHQPLVMRRSAQFLDMPGLNYILWSYNDYLSLKQQLLLGTETASTVSSRGQYMLPVREGKDVAHSNLQCTSYDVEYCS